MNNQRRAISWNDRPHQNHFNKIPCGHQHVKPVTTVLHTSFQYLALMIKHIHLATTAIAGIDILC